LLSDWYFEASLASEPRFPGMEQIQLSSEMEKLENCGVVMVHRKRNA
jgi:hypothetical protein